MDSLCKAIQVMHERYHIPHIVITSVSLQHADQPAGSLSVIGSTMTSDRRARPFKIAFPAFDCYFSGTGDMFAALMVVRMREAVFRVPGLVGRDSWVSEDGVAPLELPLARAAEKVLASMHEVLEKTCRAMTAEMAGAEASAAREAGDQTRLHLLQSRAAELRLVRNLDSLRFPDVQLRATEM
jgi:pyridoxine kinase